MKLVAFAALRASSSDAAAVTAEGLGYTVLAGAADKPHGLREAYIADPDGYVWVLDRPLAG